MPKDNNPKIEKGLSKKQAALMEREAKQLGSQANIGYSNKPEDMIYIGEDGQLDPDEWVSLHLGASHPADRVLRSVVQQSLPDVDDDELNQRVRDALKALFNIELAKGRPKQIASQEVVLIAMAEAYWAARCKDSRATISVSKIVGQVFSDPRILGNEKRDPDDKSFRDQWVGRFNSQKERLLKQHTASFEEAQKVRVLTENRILNDMKFLGFW